MNSTVIMYVPLLLGYAAVIGAAAWLAAVLRKAQKSLRGAEAEKEELKSLITEAGAAIDVLNDTVDGLLARIGEKNGEAESYIGQLSRLLGEIEKNQPAEPAAAAAEILPRYRKYRQVTRFIEEGMDEAEIAKELNIGRGEVALIQGLRVKAGGTA